MNPRRRLGVVGLLAVGTVLLWWLGRPANPPADARDPAKAAEPAAAAPGLAGPRADPSPGATVAGTGGADRSADAVGAGASSRLDTPEARLAEKLNHPDQSLREDVAVVGSMIAAFRSLFRESGNPVGDNIDITATLTGRNPRGLILLRPDHPAIGPDGRLRDRFGNPFHFHAESGTRMEVRSAGPDGRLYTPDDVTMMP